MKTKIQIKSYLGEVLFEHESEGNTIKSTLVEAVKSRVDLRGANLYRADLYGVDLRGANLRGVDLRGANLRGVDLRGANLYEVDLRGVDLYRANLRGVDLRGANLYGANLRGVDLRGANLKKLPVDFINQCSRDMLFIFQQLKDELPAFKEKLLAGKVNGSQYEGDCACLLGTFAKVKKEKVDKVCKVIPFYEKGTHNMGEAWFLNIKEGDTPKSNGFANHVLKLIEMVETGKYKTIDY